MKLDTRHARWLLLVIGILTLGALVTCGEVQPPGVTDETCRWDSNSWDGCPIGP